MLLDKAGRFCYRFLLKKEKKKRKEREQKNKKERKEKERRGKRMVKKKFNVPFDKTKSNENKIVTFDIDNNEISIYNYDWDLKFDKSSYRLSFVPLQKLIVHFQMGKTKKKKKSKKKEKRKRR